MTSICTNNHDDCTTPYCAFCGAELMPGIDSLRRYLKAQVDRRGAGLAALEKEASDESIGEFQRNRAIEKVPDSKQAHRKWKSWLQIVTSMNDSKTDSQ